MPKLAKPKPPRSPRLKVFRTAIGFHDALVAAPSRRAALAAWGAEADLFARGVAEEVTDPALTAEALARPGEVIRRSRGTAAEQLAALPPDRPKAERPAAMEPNDATELRARKRAGARGPGGGRRGSSVPAPAPEAVAPPPPKPLPPRPRAPRPDPDALDAAEDALAAADKRRRAALADLAERERRLVRERRELEREQADEVERLTRARDDARRAYDAGMRAWRGGGDGG